jgi:hypothetical protein
MATGGLYGQSNAGIVSPQSGSESSGLYGNNTVFGGTYFEWFIFQEAASQPATPTDGSWSFVTNSGTPPAGWTLQPPSNPLNQVWVSIALVNSKTTATLVWSTPGLFGVIPNFTFPTPITGAAGSNAAVVNVGTATNPSLQFTIPRGDKGDKGDAATIAVGATTTTNPGTFASVTNVGTSAAAVFNFGIPKGAGVNSGGTVGQILTKASNTDYDTTWTSITGGLNFQGTWNASTNTPTLTSSVGTNGFYYIVDTAGSTNLNGVTDWQVGDWVIFNGSTWQKLDQTNLVTSVAGRTGAVVLSNTDISGLGTMSTQNANAVAITGGNIQLDPSTTSAAPLHLPYGVSPTAPASGDIWSTSTGLYVKNSGGVVKQLDLADNTPGTLSMPNITVTGSGSTINVDSVSATIFASANWAGDIKTYVIPAATGLGLTDQSANYLVVNYNSGSPVYQITTNVTTINNSSIVGAALLWRNGTQVHYQPIDWGLSTASRLNRRLVQTNRYQWASGLALGETTGRIITCTAGVIWYGVTQYNELVTDSSSSNAEFWFHSSGAWTSSTVSTYNNTQYDNGTNLVNTGGANYVVNWVWRYIDGSGLPKLAYVLGGGNYTLPQAQASSPTVPPPILSTMAILVGRIIVKTAATTATQIDSAFTQVFTSGTVIDHNDLGGLQGGTVNEEYHLTSAEYTGTGTGVFVRSTSPTLVTPALGTPTALVGTNITGTAAGLSIGGNAATATTATTATTAGSATTAGTATNLAGGAASQIPYQTGAGATSFIANGTSGQVLTSNGTSVPTWTTPTAYATVTDDTTTNLTRYPLFAAATSGNLTTEYTSSTKYQFNPSTGVLTATQFSGSGAGLTGTAISLSIGGNAATATLSTSSTNLAGGANGSVPYQTGSGSTTFLAAGTNGYILTLASGVPTWAAAPVTGITVTDDTTTNATRYLTFTSATTGSVTSENVSSTKLQYNPSTGALSSTSFSGAGTGLTGTASSLSIGGNAANVTGTVAIANGGTGQTTKTSAYDALSPTTTKGDLEVNNGTNNVRFGVGTNGYVLTADSTQATGLKWAAGGGGASTPAAVSDQANTSTGYFSIPLGTVAQRPVSPQSGSIRMNSTLDLPEWYDTVSATWIPFSTAITYSATYLIVSGGGGGGGGVVGATNGAGGGAGGLVSATSTLTAGTTYSIVVGAGGSGGSSTSGSTGANSSSGGASSLGGGGGGGGSPGQAGANGGSGGGGTAIGAGGGTNAGGLGTAGQGNNGAAGNNATPFQGGGGGGASAAGNTVTTGQGGVGTASSITGSSVTYAGGGSGGTNALSAIAGGTGGGGAGGYGLIGFLNGVAGTANTGGGGGGGATNSIGSGLGANGGSGVVIISIPTNKYTGVTTGSPTVTTSGGNTIMKFTSSGSYTA